MMKANKGLIARLFEWKGIPWSKVRWRTNVAVLLIDFLYKMFIMVKKLMVKTMGKMMVKTMGKTKTKIDLMIVRFDYICIDLIIY